MIIGLSGNISTQTGLSENILWLISPSEIISWLTWLSGTITRLSGTITELWSTTGLGNLTSENCDLTQLEDWRSPHQPPSQDEPGGWQTLSFITELWHSVDVDLNSKRSCFKHLSLLCGWYGWPFYPAFSPLGCALKGLCLMASQGPAQFSLTTLLFGYHAQSHISFSILLPA